MKYGKFCKNDNWETPIDYLEVIEPFIPKDIIINDPFYMNGNVKKTWKKLGREIIHENKDFFNIKKSTKNEIYVSSPPYTKTHKILKHLFYLDKPFILLLPMNKIAQIKIQTLLKNREHIQLIPSPVYKGFINEKGEKTRCSPNYIGFLCYKLYLKKDLLYI